MDGVKFTMDVSSSGAAKLKECVKNKLSEYIGNYTDDVLVVRFLITSYENTRVASVCRIQTSSCPVSYSKYISDSHSCMFNVGFICSTYVVVFECTLMACDSEEKKIEVVT